MLTCYRAEVERFKKVPAVLTLGLFGVLHACPRFARGLDCDSTWRKTVKLPKAIDREPLVDADVQVRIGGIVTRRVGRF